MRHLTWTTSTKVFINHVSGVFVTYSNVSAEYSDNAFINKNLNYEGTCHTAERSNIYTLMLYTSDQGRNSLVATLRWEKKNTARNQILCYSRLLRGTERQHTV